MSKLINHALAGSSANNEGKAEAKGRENQQS